MAYDGSKRPSDPHSQTPPTVNPPFWQQQSAAPRYSDVAKNVFEKLPFRIGPRKQYAQPASSTSSADQRHGSFAAVQAVGPITSQSTHFDAGFKIRALDINKARTHVVLAGSKLLRTVRVDGTRCDEDFDIRQKTLDFLEGTSNGRSISKTTQSQPNRDVAATQRAFFDIEDVAWSNGRFDKVIATAASNGAIILYDLDRPEVEAQKLQKHDRQVHKVDFNPMEGKCLLSGSQDGTVILWDLRVGQANRIDCTRSGVYDSRSDGVRHVKWSPVDDWAFAFSTDNGFVHRWDTRQQRSPVWKVAAHEGTCTSIDWHPDGRHVVSAGKDKTVKVWAVAQEQRRRKALYEFRAPHEVQNVRWRPVCSILGPDAISYAQSTQLATSYKKEPMLHVWDLRRPSIPFTEVHYSFNKGTTDMLWHSRDLLWTVGPSGRFMQTDIYHSHRTINRRSLQTVRTSTSGESTFFVQKRPRTLKAPFSSQGDTVLDKDDKSKTRYFEGTGLGRSFGDDSLDEKFLAPPLLRRSSSQTKPGSLSARSLGSTPPSLEDGQSAVLPLDQAMSRIVSQKPIQVSQTGSVPGLGQATIFTYFARRFKLRPLSRSLTAEEFIDAYKAFEKNAEHMQRASRYRDAQTWKMLGQQISIELKRRAESNKNRRLHSMPKLMHEKSHIKSTSRHSLIRSQLEQSAIDNRTGSQSRIPLPDANSDAATPLARPVKAGDIQDRDSEITLEGDPVQLPPSLASNQNHSRGLSSDLAVPSITETSQVGANEEDGSSINPAISHQNERRAMVNEWKAQPKTPLNLDQPIEHSRNIAVPARMERRDSSDSFLMFSTSSGSHPKMSTSDSLMSRESHSVSTGQENISWTSRGGYDPSSFQSTQSDGTGGSSDVASEPRPFDIDTSAANSPEMSRQGSQLGQSGSLPRSYDNDRQIGTQDSSLSYENQSSRKLDTLDEHYTPFPADGIPNRVRKLPSIAETNVAKEHAKPPTPQLPANIKITGEEDVLTEDFLALDFADFEANNLSEMPIAASDMLQQLMVWYSSHADAQMASNLIIQSLPFLAPSSSFANTEALSKEAASVVGSLMTLMGRTRHGQFAGGEQSLERSAMEDLGLDPVWIESILETYHEQLVSQNLIIPAADLRKVAHPEFPSVYDQGLKDVQTGLLCLNCKSPINNPDNKLRCETCQARQADCPICWSRISPFGASPLVKSNKKESPSKQHFSDDMDGGLGKGTRLWSSCPLCNHSAHAACAFTWFEDIEAQGACPVSGCLCDCTRGKYRDQRLFRAEVQELQKGGRRGGVKKDEWTVGESRAVGRVRGALKERSSISGEVTPLVSGGELEKMDEERRVRIRTPVGMKGASN